MKQFFRTFILQPSERRYVTWGDGVVLLGLATLIYLGTKLAAGAPSSI